MINTCEQRITKKLNKNKRKEGVENLQLVEDQNLNLYRVRYSKHDLKKIHSLNSIKNLCLDIES